AIDYMGNAQITPTEADRLFRHYANFPTKIILKEGIRVMFLNNSLFTKGLFNGSIGIVLKIIDYDTIEVAFPLKTVHKTQGLTLPHITVSLDETIFA
ncbi:4890_t:CDS:2, partial [Diversispora eburnea]